MVNDIKNSVKWNQFHFTGPSVCELAWKKKKKKVGICFPLISSLGWCILFTGECHFVYFVKESMVSFYKDSPMTRWRDFGKMKSNLVLVQRTYGRDFSMLLKLEWVSGNDHHGWVSQGPPHPTMKYSLAYCPTYCSHRTQQAHMKWSLPYFATKEYILVSAWASGVCWSTVPWT